MFNERLLQEGLARVETVPPNTRYSSRFEAAEAGAQAAGLGIWSLPPDQLADFLNGTCSPTRQKSSQPEPSPQPAQATPEPETPTTPAQSGRITPLPDGSCPSEAPIKGNAQSHIYHVPNGQFYGKTKAEACFANASDAQAAGFRASKR